MDRSCGLTHACLWSGTVRGRLLSAEGLNVYETYLSAFILFLLIAGLKPVLLMLFLIFPLLGLLFWFSVTGLGPVIVLLRLIGP